MLGMILSGSAAIAQAFRHEDYLAALSDFFGALELVLGFSHKARHHALLHRRSSELLAGIKTRQDPDDRCLGEWERKRLMIEAGEPPIYWALEASCDNEVRFAWARENKGLIKPSILQELPVNWLTFHKTEFKIVRPITPAAVAETA